MKTSPRLTWGSSPQVIFYVSVLSPWLLRGCSHARIQQSGLVKNGPSGARCGGIRPGTARSRMASAAPSSLDQWSRPSSRTLGAHPEPPIPMPSRGARPAGHRYSCDDQPLVPQARHTGYLPWMRRAAAWRSRAAAAPMRLRSKRRVRWALRLQTAPGERRSARASRAADRACQLIEPTRTRFRQQLQRSAETVAARGDIAVPGKPGRGRPQPGRMRGSAGDSGAVWSRPHGGYVRPGRPTVGWGGNGSQGSARDGQSGTAADNSGNGPLRPSGEVTGVQGRCALPRRRAGGGRPCSSPRWSSPPRCGGRCRRRG